jgi:hypothetical protein
LSTVTVPDNVTNIGSNAFSGCPLTTITIPSSVTSIGDGAFSDCTDLRGVYCQGKAPGADSTVFSGDTNATVYYFPWTTGWGATFGGAPTWNPKVQTSGATFGVRTNHFGFTITGNSNLVIVVVASTNLANPIWSPLQTNTLTGGSSYFSDPKWTNYARRFYRLRSP